MTAIDVIQLLMEETQTTLAELAEYSDLSSKQSVYQALRQKDLKVGTFLQLLEVMGYQLVVQHCETNDEYVIDYDKEVL